MKTFRLQESKTTLLKKLLNNGNITEEQFHIANDFFKRHTAFEKEIDWNRGLNITWDELSSVIYKERNNKSQARKKIRKGLEGFTEGKDYLVLDEGIYNGEPWVAYQPFTWEASRMIASHYVEPSKNENGEVEDANWCTAYQKNKYHWDSHNESEAFIYLCGETIPTKKIAISISEEDYDASGSDFLYSTDSLNYNIWDFEDYQNTIKDEGIRRIISNLDDLIERTYKNWNTLGFKYNSETGRYDYDGSLYIKALRRHLKPNKDGFTINFGRVTGNFDCFELGLTSLEGAPQEVGGDFNCQGNQLTSLKEAPQTVGKGFYCSYNQLISLEGAPHIVGGNFYCHNNQLTSLEGAPQEVGGYFDCSENNLTSLEGAPQEVGGWFTCSINNLTSLEGAPQEVGRDFYCNDNHLTSLKGAPQTVGGSFYCSSHQLTSLKGAPQTVGGDFYCNSNQLISLEGAPQEIGRDFDCSYNYLTSLKGAPQKIDGNFGCSENKLTSLEGAPQNVGGEFECSYNQLTFLEGAPREVGGSFDCRWNQLTSLEGAPQTVGKGFYCYNNKLVSLKGAPKTVGGDFDCSYNPSLHSLEGIGKVKGIIYKDF